MYKKVADSADKTSTSSTFVFEGFVNQALAALFFCLYALHIVEDSAAPRECVGLPAHGYHYAAYTSSGAAV